MAADDERLRRPDPDRTGPNRSFGGIFKNDPWSQRDDFWHQRNGRSGLNGHNGFNGRHQSTDSDRPEPDYAHSESFDGRTESPESPAESFASVAQEAVDLAYKISEPYLRAGLRAAEAYTVRENGIPNSFENPFKGGGTMNQPYGDPMSQMYGQLARTYAEFMVSLARAAYGGWYPPASPYRSYPRQRDGCGPTDQSRCYPQPPPSYCDSRPYPQSQQAERMEIKLSPPSSRSAHIRRHHYASGEQPRLKWLINTKDPSVKLEPKEVHSNGTVTFNVEVTADQPVGTYTGPIIDDKTGRDIGTVSIEITERKP